VSVVFNGKYLAIDDAVVSREIVRQMQVHGIDEVVHVLGDGSIRHFAK